MPAPWKHNGVRVIPGNRSTPTPRRRRGCPGRGDQLGPRRRAKIWAGTVTIQPNAKTGAHHHGELESVIYVVKGRARMRWGERLEYRRRGRPGRLHLRPALCAAPGDQRQSRRDAGMRAGAERQRSGRRQSRHRAGGEAGGGAVDRPDPSPACGVRWYAASRRGFCISFPSPARHAWEGGRTPDEALPCHLLLSQREFVLKKEPSPALRAPSPIASQRGEGEGWRQPALPLLRNGRGKEGGSPLSDCFATGEGQEGGRRRAHAKITGKTGLGARRRR